MAGATIFNDNTLDFRLTDFRTVFLVNVDGTDIEFKPFGKDFRVLNGAFSRLVGTRSNGSRINYQLESGKQFTQGVQVTVIGPTDATVIFSGADTLLAKAHRTEPLNISPGTYSGGFNVQVPLPPLSTSSSDPASGSQSSATTMKTEPEKTLPPGWECFITRTGRPLFANVDILAVAWVPPAEETPIVDPLASSTSSLAMNSLQLSNTSTPASSSQASGTLDRSSTDLPELTDRSSVSLLLREVHTGTVEYDQVTATFLQGWYPPVLPRPDIVRVLSVTVPNKYLGSHKEHTRKVASTVGELYVSEHSLFCALERTCRLGNTSPVSEPCHDRDCLVCMTITRSFTWWNYRPPAQRPAGVLGPWLHLSSASAKADKLVRAPPGVPRTMFMVKAVLGRGLKYVASPMRRQEGFHSVFGRPNGEMYEQQAVWNANAVRPEYLIIYKTS